MTKIVISSQEQFVSASMTFFVEDKTSNARRCACPHGGSMNSQERVLLTHLEENIRKGARLVDTRILLLELWGVRQNPKSDLVNFAVQKRSFLGV